MGETDLKGLLDQRFQREVATGVKPEEFRDERSANRIDLDPMC
jgi:hypothetical protein